MPDKVYIDFDNAQELRWTRKAANGRIIADSSEGYKNVTDCLDMAIRVNGLDQEYFLYGHPYSVESYTDSF